MTEQSGRDSHFNLLHMILSRPALAPTRLANRETGPGGDDRPSALIFLLTPCTFLLYNTGCICTAKLHGKTITRRGGQHMADRSGQQIDKYRLLRLLGSGAFAEVYLAEHRIMKSQAAVKLLPVGSNPPEQLARSFEQEVQTVARLQHPHIVRILDCGVDPQQGVLYIIMDYAPQGSLRTKYKAGEQVPLPTVVSHISQIADALHYAHQQGYIHRDVKPENVLIGPNGTLWLSDFGLVAQAHGTASLKTLDASGTLEYIAPEQLQKHPRPASDQYALAIMAYEWLCGERPFTGNIPQLMYQHLMVLMPSLCEKVPTLPKAVEQVLAKALSKDPKERYESVQAFSAALQSAVFIDGKTKEQWKEEGDAHSEAKRYEEAIDAYSRAIELAPTYATAYNNRGIAYFNQQHYEQAIADYNRAIELDPTYAKAYHNRGYAYDDLGHYEQAIADYSSAIELDPTYATAYNGRGYTYEQMKLYEQAMRDYTRALELDPNHTKARNNKARLEKQMGKR